MGVYIGYYGIITILFIILTKCSFRIPLNNIHLNRRTKQFEKQMALFTFIAALMLIFILGCRSEYQGGDLHNSLGTGYFFFYEVINRDTLIEIFQNFGDQKYANFEIGFVIFCKFIGTLCSNRQILLIGSALISIAPVAYFINKSSKNKWLSFILYMAIPFFATMLFSGIRQGIAMGMIMMSYQFVKEKRLAAFILIILLACTFHSTAIVALIAYPAYNIHLNRASALVGGTGLLAIIFILKEPLFKVLIRLVTKKTAFDRNDSVNLFILLTLIYMLCVLLYKEKDYETRGFINIFWLACGAQAFSGLHNLVGRITWYFMSILAVLIPNLVENINIKEKQIKKPISWVVGILAILLGLYYLKYDIAANACPYVPFWTQ